MITLQQAKKIVHGQQLTPRDQVIVLLAIEPSAPCPTETVKKRCVDVGLPKLAKKNLSDILSRANGYVARTAQGWELQEAAIARVRELLSTEQVRFDFTPEKGVPNRASLTARVEDVLLLLSAFSDCVGYSQNRRNSPILALTDESRVQDLMYFMLRPAVGELVAEHPVANGTRQYSLEDYLCRNLATVVEAKFVRSRPHGRELKKELHDDIGEYKADPVCKHLIFFIYDPAKHIESPTSLKNAVEGIHIHNGKSLTVYCVIQT